MSRETCRFCRYNNYQHGKDCPWDDATAQVQWQQGYSDGWVGYSDYDNNQPAYSYGWTAGNSARDAWEENELQVWLEDD